MFWKKKIEEKISNSGDIFWNDAKPKYRPFYGSHELVTKEDYNQLDQKLNLIFDHLNLKYVPETEKKEPAKLVEKKSFSLGVDWGVVGDGCSITSTWKPTFTLEAKKKKRGRPKKK